MTIPSDDILESLMPACEHIYAEVSFRNDVLVARCTKCHKTKGTPLESISEAQMVKLKNDFTEVARGPHVGQA